MYETAMSKLPLFCERSVLAFNSDGLVSERIEKSDFKRMEEPAHVLKLHHASKLVKVVTQAVYSSWQNVSLVSRFHCAHSGVSVFAVALATVLASRFQRFEIESSALFVNLSRVRHSGYGHVAISDIEYFETPH